MSSSRVPLRSLIVVLTVGSFSIAALMGVVALLGGGEFGETERRVLLTTLVVGVASVAILCHLATSGTPFVPVGVVGGLLTLVPLTTVLMLIWRDWSGDPGEALLKTFGVGAIVAGTFAQASLLLVLAARGPAAVRGLLVGTLLLAVWLAAQTSALVLGYDATDDGTFFRVLGVVAILDVLGTVVVPALARFGNWAAEERVDRLVVPPDLAARVVQRAQMTGQRPDEVLRLALDAHLGDPRFQP